MFNAQEFKAACSKCNLTLELVAREIGINPSTLYRKTIGESDFTRAEIQNLARLLGLTGHDVERIFFAEELA